MTASFQIPYYSPFILICTTHSKLQTSENDIILLTKALAKKKMQALTCKHILASIWMIQNWPETLIWRGFYSFPQIILSKPVMFF